MDSWLADARDRLAELAGVPPVELEIDEDTEATLLELARVAAHESGARTNAPLLCYLVGRVAGSVRPEDVSERLHRDPI